ncbi:MAG: choice-of-anchor E domain-containing protein, partial [Flavitalea sp.]
MKTSLLLATFILLSAIALTAHSQQTIITKLTYDTTVNGTGSVFAPYQFSFPKFSASLGTLGEVRIASVLSWSYSYTIENKDAVLGTAKIKILRSDVIDGTTLSTPLIYDFTNTRPNKILSASDGVPNSGPDFYAPSALQFASGDTVINQALYNTADYMGPGTVDFQYSPEVGYSQSGPNIDFKGQAVDQIKMSLTYIYSNPSILAKTITSFTANKRDRSVNLNWHTTNETSDRSYEILTSTDGKVFTIVSTLNASPDGSQTGNYQFNYIPGSDEKGKLFFQIKQIELRGTAKYSAQRSVDF